MIYDGTISSLNEGDEVYSVDSYKERDKFVEDYNPLDFSVESGLGDVHVYSAVPNDPFISPKGSPFLYIVAGCYYQSAYSDALYVQYTNSEKTYNEWYAEYEEQSED